MGDARAKSNGGEECKRCEGRGYHLEGDLRAARAERCIHCHGTGKVCRVCNPESPLTPGGREDAPLTIGAREAAVEIVNGLRGYGISFAPDPAAHRSDYAFAEAVIKRECGASPPPASPYLAALAKARAFIFKLSEPGCGCWQVCRCNEEAALRIWKDEVQSEAREALTSLDAALAGDGAGSERRETAAEIAASLSPEMFAAVRSGVFDLIGENTVAKATKLGLYEPHPMFGHKMTNLGLAVIEAREAPSSLDGEKGADAK